MVQNNMRFGPCSFHYSVMSEDQCEVQAHSLQVPQGSTCDQPGHFALARKYRVVAGVAARTGS
jgi:hypothetical protein